MLDNKIIFLLLSNIIIVVIFIQIVFNINSKISSISLESLCKKDGNCFYSSKNGTLSVNNIVSENVLTPKLTITPKSLSETGKIVFINGEVECKSLSC